MLLQNSSALHAQLALLLVDHSAQSLLAIELFLPLQDLNLLLLDRILLVLFLLFIILALLATKDFLKICDTVTVLMDTELAYLTENDRVQVTKVGKKTDLASKGCLFNDIIGNF